MKKLIALLLALVMVLGLVACASKTTDETPKTDDSAAAPADTETTDNTAEPADTETTDTAEETTGEERPYYVRDAKDVTGTLTVYTTIGETEQQALRDVWTKYYPDCKLEFQSDSVGTLATRIRSDETCDADVVIGGMFAADGDTYHDILQPYTAACDAEQLYHDPAGYYTFYDVQLMCLVVNPELRDELGIEINGYEDLLNPELKGRIAMCSPSSSSSAWEQLINMLYAMGEGEPEEGWDYVEEFIANLDGVLLESSSEVYQGVADGRFTVGLTFEEGAAHYVAEGQPVKIVYMEEGVISRPDVVAIVKGTIHEAEAEQFVDFVTGLDAQQTISSQLDRRTVRLDVEEPSYLPDKGQLHIIWDDEELSGQKKALWLERFAGLYEKSVTAP